MSNILKNNVWQLLVAHKAKLANLKLKSLFIQDNLPDNTKPRFDTFSLEAAELFLDYSKQRVLPETMSLLLQLAESVDIAAKRDAMFSGATINSTEQRAVLHTALRDPSARAVIVDGVNIKPLICTAMQRVERCVTEVRSGVWQGYSNQSIKAIVNIGIGGSDLGPAMATAALSPYTMRELEYYFVSNIDAAHINETLRRLDPATTLFIVASKTFTTQETLCNALTAKKWLLDSVAAAAPTNASANVNQSADAQNAISAAERAVLRHFIAVTAKPERARAFGIEEENIYPFWDWVGGRYSLWSAIGLSLAIAIGMENFKALLAGAHAMDNHFQNAPYATNMPVIMALLGIWNINFWHNATYAVIPYSQYLNLLPFYLQQLEMESNGKHVRLDGAAVNYATAPITWGAVGTNGQHAFHQLLMQGTQTVPVDFIVAARSNNDVGDHHTLLVANCLAQSQALMQGRSAAEAFDEICMQQERDSQASRGSDTTGRAGNGSAGKVMSAAEARQLAEHKAIAGDVPSSTIMLPQLTPRALGALLALYEHKTFVQGVIWDINSFDQWGVELGKQLANKIATKMGLGDVKHKDENSKDGDGNSAILGYDDASIDSSTRGLMQRFYKLR